MSTIAKLQAMELLDSRGHPTVGVSLELSSGHRAEASVPSGASTGSAEACELRDGDTGRYGGRGVLGAVAAVNGELNAALRGRVAEQREVDHAMIALDGTERRSRLGANALLGVSMALARAVAAERGVPLYRHLCELYGGDPEQLSLPLPMMNILNGGAHANNNIDLQEFMVQPVGAPNFAEALRWGTEIFHTLRGLLREEGHPTAVGDEGGFAPNLSGSAAALELLCRAVESAGLRLGRDADVALALDCAATELCRDSRYQLLGEAGQPQLDTTEFIDYLRQLCERYPVASIEDALHEDDWAGWVELTVALGTGTQLVGDDLFVTDARRLRRGAELGAANAILIKPNQIGTVSETLDTLSTARKIGYATVISHRSGETEDCFIADLAVATAAGQIKTGAPCRSDRVAKYNRLLRIESQSEGAIPLARGA